MALTTAILAALHLSQLASGLPTLTFPLNAQLPPAARVDTFFSYSFSPQTFDSGKKITYSLGNVRPDWLSIESDKRRLYGTPKDSDVAAGDVVGQQVDIVATDETGSTTMTSTLVVSRSKAPTIDIPLSKQIAGFGNYSAPSSILSYPSQDFRYTFNRSTWSNQAQLNYYAVSLDNSPLPAWIQFDPATLTFSGKTPPFENLIQPPQTFELSLVASDIIGFSASSIPFAIVVGTHKLSTRNPIISLNATRGSKVTYDGLQDGITLDMKPVNMGDLSATTKDMPQWLLFDGKSGKLQGTPGGGDHSTNFTITFTDRHGDTLDVLVVVNVGTGLFESTFEDMQLRPGAKFDVNLAKYFKNPDDITIKVSTSPSEDWIKVDGFRLSGTAPKTAKGGFDIMIDAASKSSKLTESERLRVTFLAPDGTTTTVPSATGTSPENSATDGVGADASSGGPRRLSTGDILLATIIPILFIALIIMLLVCFLRRRRANRGSASNKRRNTISSPVPGSFRVERSPDVVQYKKEKTTMAMAEKQGYKTGKNLFLQPVSPVSSVMCRSSETLGNVSPERHSMDMDGVSATVRDISRPVSVNNNNNRQSWETVEGDAAHAMMSGGKSMYDDDDVYESIDDIDITHQLFAPPTGPRSIPIPGAKLPRRGLDQQHNSVTVNNNMYPEVQPPPTAMFNPHSSAYKSIDAYSSITTSSAALPAHEISTLENHPPRPMASTIMETEASEPNWEALSGTDASSGSAYEVHRPEPAALSGKTTGDLRAWQQGVQPPGSKGLLNDASFGSSENWRVVGKRENTGLTHKDVVEEEAPSHFSRPTTAGKDQDRVSLDLLSPSKWGDMNKRANTMARHESMARISMSVISVVSAMSTDWQPDESGRFSEGSYKVFI